LRVFTVRRSDQNRATQLAWFLIIAPIATLWQWSVLRVWRLWAIASCMRFKWGARQQVEVSIGGDHEKVLASAAAAAVGWMLDETVVHLQKPAGVQLPRQTVRSERDRSGRPL
jgi:hyaluronan synthase